MSEPSRPKRLNTEGKITPFESVSQDIPADVRGKELDIVLEETGIGDVAVPLSAIDDLGNDVAVIVKPDKGLEEIKRNDTTYSYVRPKIVDKIKKDKEKEQELLDAIEQYRKENPNHDYPARITYPNKPL